MTLFDILQDAFFAFFIATGFSFLFNTPKHSIWVAGLLGALGHATRFILLGYFDMGIVTATLLSAIEIGLFAIYFAPIVNTPPVVFSMPACITMIPGLFAYRTMIGFIRLSDPESLIGDNQVITTTAYNLTITASLLFTLAIGISVVVLFFRKKSVRELIEK